MLDLSQHTEALARRLAAEQHKSVDVVVRGALEAILKCPQENHVPLDAHGARRAALDRATAAIAALPELDGGISKAIMDDLDPL